MNLDQFQELLQIVDLLDPHRDSDLASLAALCQEREALETFAYLADCEHRRLTPRLCLIRHFVNVDFSGSG